MLFTKIRIMSAQCLFGLGNLSECCGEAIPSVLANVGRAILFCVDRAAAIFNWSHVSVNEKLGVRTH